MKSSKQYGLISSGGTTWRAQLRPCPSRMYNESVRVCVCVFYVVVLVLAGIGWNRYQFSDAAATAFVICAGTVETQNQSRSDTV